MSALELVQLLTGSGVFTGGLAAAAWVLRTERRLMKLEVKAKIA
ncbi:hypothetical protein [Massilia luteola]|jgi:hypothetical protein|nr:hypothetical protein [Massilia sp. Gc5]